MNNANKRQSKILSMLRTRKYLKVDDIAKEVQVSERTIRRDLEFFKIEFPQIKVKQGVNGGIFWNE